MNSHTSIYNETYVRILKLLQNHGDNLRLPPEADIAKLLGVSRMTVRDVLAEMEAKGYVNRRRGAGTVINKHILELTARLDIDNFYKDMVENSGFEPSCNIKKLMLVQEITSDIRNSLELDEGEKVYLIKKILNASGQPVICINDYLPERYYDKDNIDIPLIEKSTFLFLQRNCDELLDTSVSYLDTVLAEKDLASLMKIKDGTPLLKLETIVYSIKQRPLMYSIEYINTKIMKFSIQKRLTRYNYIDCKNRW